MARKSAKSKLSPEAISAMEVMEIEAEVRGEMADVAIELQDKPTKKLIEKMVNELRQNVTPGALSREAVDGNLRFLATEILKDLAVFDIRVGTYVIPPANCVLCGVEL